MIHNKHILILALPRWDGKYESASFNIACELAKTNNVLFVDNPFTLTEIIKNLNSIQIKKRLLNFLPFSSGIRRYEHNGIRLHLLAVPLVIPINFLKAGRLYAALSRLNHFILATRIKKAIHTLKIPEYIFINSWNFYYPKLDRYLQPELFLYHCVDAMVRPYTLRHGPYLEKQIVAKADIVVSTSQALQQQHQQNNPHSYFIPNAADFVHSSKTLSEKTMVAYELKNLNHPIIGYFGNIERRIDYALLKQVLIKHPDWTLVLVGPVDRTFFPAWFEKLPNVKLIGPRPYQRMPEFLKGFDVAVIPFKVDRVSRTIFPLKLFEYLGSGKPVVTTPFNPDALASLTSVTYIGKTADEFEQAILNAFDENDQTIIERRLQIARENTWEARGIEFGELIEQHLQGKNDKAKIWTGTSNGIHTVDKE